VVVRGKGGTTTGKPRRMGEHPGGVPEPRRHDRSNPVTTARPFTLGHLACSSCSKYLGSISIRLGDDESGTPAGVQESSRNGTRRPPPPRPSATSGYPLATLRVDQSRRSNLQRQAGGPPHMAHVRGRLCPPPSSGLLLLCSREKNHLRRQLARRLTPHSALRPPSAVLLRRTGTPQ
jgi:hypothetical protein